MTPLLSNPLLRAQSDDRLAALAATGHDRAFEAIVERYRKPLARYLRRLLSEQLAEDVLQATFVRAWQALGTGTQVRDLRPWLYRIAHNQAVNALRAAGPAESELPDGLAATAAAPDVAAEHSEALRSALRGIGGLPDRQRAALMAIAVENRPHADVAAELGLTDGALRQLLLRARTALRAAATAITPYPLVAWLSAGQEAGAARVAEVAAGAGGIGVAAKAGAALLAAGALVAGAPALRDEHVPHLRHATTQSASRPEHVTTTKLLADDRRATTSTVVRHSATAPAASRAVHRQGGGGPGERRGRSGQSGSSSREDDGERSGSGSHDSGSHESDDGGHGSSRPGTALSIRPAPSGDDGSGDRRSGDGGSVQPSGTGSDDGASGSPGVGELDGSGSTSGATAPTETMPSGSGDGSGWYGSDGSGSGSGD